jgi:uncharacterized glyoxalase superfamily protein PhnB
MPDLIPCLSVRDPRQTQHWFETLGFQTLYTMPMPDGTIAHAHVTRGGAHIMFGPDSCGSGVGSNGMQLYLSVGDEDVDALYARLQRAGIAVGAEPQDQFWGDRTFEVTHPDGYKITFSKHVRDVSEEEMQEAVNQWAAQAAAVPA